MYIISTDFGKIICNSCFVIPMFYVVMTLFYLLYDYSKIFSKF